MTQEEVDRNNAEYDASQQAEALETQNYIDSQQARVDAGEKVDRFRTFLVQRTWNNHDFVFEKEVLPEGQERALAKRSIEMMNSDFKSEYIDFIREVLKGGDGVAIMKDTEGTNLEAIMYREDNVNFDKYINSEWVILPEETAFAIVFENQKNLLVDKQWTQIPESRYDYMFEQLPPMKYKSIEDATLFMCSEAETGSLHGCYAHVDRKYYTAVKDKFDNYDVFLTEIREQASSGTLKENTLVDKIKIAVDEGRVVNWANEAYVVEKTRYDYDIVCTINESRIGLTHRDGETLNGKDEDFIIHGEEAEVVRKAKERIKKMKEENIKARVESTKEGMKP